MADDQEPSDPFGALSAGAVAMHEVYKTLIQAGFTEKQAMQIVVAQWVEGVRLAINHLSLGGETNPQS